MFNTAEYSSLLFFSGLTRLGSLSSVDSSCDPSSGLCTPAKVLCTPDTVSILSDIILVDGCTPDDSSDGGVVVLVTAVIPVVIFRAHFSSCTGEEIFPFAPAAC